MINPRLQHALTYSTLRSLEMDLHREKYSFIEVGNKLKHACLDGEINPQGGGDSILYPHSQTALQKERTTHQKESNHKKEKSEPKTKELLTKEELFAYVNYLMDFLE